MGISVSVDIQATRQDVWKVITDIDNAEKNISAIEKVEVLERPEHGFVGLKWRETRQMFGKSATEVMWITEAQENEGYKTRAESHGSVYVSSFALSSQGDATRLTMAFDATPQNLLSKVMAATVGKLFEGSMRSTVRKDLEDIKRVVESGGRADAATG